MSIIPVIFIRINKIRQEVLILFTRVEVFVGPGVRVPPLVVGILTINRDVPVHLKITFPS